MIQWIEPLTQVVKIELSNNKDGSHDFGHIERVSSIAVRFAKKEKANEVVCFAAAMLHDIVNLPKGQGSELSSKLAAERSEVLLRQMKFPEELLPNVCHSIHAHSFSANIEPLTIEAYVVQDADRMEALGALGLIRTFYVAGQKGSKIMHETDPRGLNREFDDRSYALDHFQVKLFKLADKMKTEAGRELATSLTDFLKEYYDIIIDGHHEIAQVYFDAGKNKISLFFLEDPFAERGRALEPSKFALDALLTSKDPYTQKLLAQLRFELNGYQS